MVNNNFFTLKTFLWVCAIGLATISGYYSIYGISKLFTGGSTSIIGMAAMLELSKLVVVVFLHNHYKTLRLSFKVYLSIAIVILMSITSIGVYGYLTNAYQKTAKTIYKSQNDIISLDQRKAIFDEQKKKLDESIKVKTDRVTSYDKLRMSQENTFNQLITTKRGTKGIQQNIKSIDVTSVNLNNELNELSKRSLALSDSISSIEQLKINISNTTYLSEIGPLIYLSNITGISMDKIVNWFILFLVAVFDPLAVSLVIAANHLNTNKVVNQKTNKNYSGNGPGVKNDHSDNDLNVKFEPNTDILTKSENSPLNLVPTMKSSLRRKNREKIKFNLVNRENNTILDKNENDITVDQDQKDQDQKDQDQKDQDQKDQDQKDQDQKDQDQKDQDQKDQDQKDQGNVEQHIFYNEEYKNRINRANVT